MPPVYLDYNATTPVDAGVLDAMRRVLESDFGNPSSVHWHGRRARALLDDCRERVSSVLRCKPSEIVFTSGATESNNLALLGSARRLQTRGRHLVTSAIEHPAVLEALRHLAAHDGFSLTEVAPDAEGCVRIEAVETALQPDTVLVSLQAANNEIGTLQPAAAVGALCRERGICFHSDAVQWFGKEPLKGIDCFNADLVSLSGHKIHGPKGAGLLFARSPRRLNRLMHGGSQEDDLRPGTENLAAIVGLTVAVERFVDPPVFDRTALAPLVSALEGGLAQLPDVAVLGSQVPRVPNTVAFTAAGCDSLSLLAALDLAGFAASSGSACSAGALQPSHVLRAMGVNNVLAAALVRLSLGRETSAAQIDRLLACLPAVIKQVRNA
ncbi:MAG: cysteine desulfurase [Verrucomicrobiales bacterium]|nr:cysteine desulfurase [Verrucomicrobiales bacterium]MCP5528582.1 cysteine desulfurase [Verrucomicrobiales bacterium]